MGWDGMGLCDAVALVILLSPAERSLPVTWTRADVPRDQRMRCALHAHSQFPWHSWHLALHLSSPLSTLRLKTTHPCMHTYQCVRYSDGSGGERWCMHTCMTSAVHTVNVWKERPGCTHRFLTAEWTQRISQIRPDFMSKWIDQVDLEMANAVETTLKTLGTKMRHAGWPT